MSMPTGTPRCQEARQQLSALQDGELAAERQARLMAHLEACPACMAEYRRIQAVWTELERLPVPPAKADFIPSVLDRIDGHPGVRRQYALWSAPRRVPAFAALALTLLLGAAAGGFLGSAALPSQPALTAEVESASTLSALDALASAPQGSLAHGYLQMTGLEDR